jgi:hypothetical protein
VLNNITVTAGFSMVTFANAEGCEAKGNNVTGTNSDSNITFVSFVGRTTGVVRCRDNKFTDNYIKVENIRLWAYMFMENNTNTGNVFSNNRMYANSGDFTYGIQILNSYNNTISGNFTNFGTLFINDTVSSDNTIVDNFFGGFTNGVIDSVTENYYRQNILRNNVSNAFLAKRALLTNDIVTVTAPESVMTTVFNRNIGVGMRTRDSYRFRISCAPTGTANTKLIVLKLRNNTTSTDSTIFSHTVPAASNSLTIAIKTEVNVDVPGELITTYTTVFDRNSGVTSSYALNITRPASTDDLSFVLEATPGASTTLVFRRIEAKFDNMYESGTW